MAGNTKEMVRSKLMVARGEGHDYGYDPKAIEHDLTIIGQLMRGKKRMTMQLAQETYYKLRRENVRFQSEKGAEFADTLSQNMTVAQVQSIDRMIAGKRRRARNLSRLLRLNRRLAIALLVITLLLCVLPVLYRYFPAYFGW
ncbi:MAG: hypothetical protein NC337_10175 [Roseburia sp.]|nr:hypothetical protein [Roseburia sp.]